MNKFTDGKPLLMRENDASEKLPFRLPLDGDDHEIFILSDQDTVEFGGPL